ncbi:MAG: DUF3592 domain-containing protein [Chthoniobacter sp.]
MFFIKDKVSFVDSMRKLVIAGFIFGALFWIPAAAFYSGSAIAVGRIIEVVPEGTEDGTAYYPKVAFEAAGAHVETVTGSIGREESAYHVGQAMRVRYRPERPSKARGDDFFSLWGLPVLIQGGCLAQIVLWSLVLRFLRKRSASMPLSSAA